MFQKEPYKAVISNLKNLNNDSLWNEHSKSSNSEFSVDPDFESSLDSLSRNSIHEQQKQPLLKSNGATTTNVEEERPSNILAALRMINMERGYTLYAIRSNLDISIAIFVYAHSDYPLRIVNSLVVDLQFQTHQILVKCSHSKEGSRSKISDMYLMLRDRFDYYNDPNNDQLLRCRNLLDNNIQIHKGNLDKLIGRGEILEKLTSDAHDLESNTFETSKKTKNLLCCFKGQHCFLYFFIVTVVAVVALLIGVALLIRYFS